MTSNVWNEDRLECRIVEALYGKRMHNQRVDPKVVIRAQFISGYNVMPVEVSAMPYSEYVGKYRDKISVEAEWTDYRLDGKIWRSRRTSGATFKPIK